MRNAGTDAIAQAVAGVGEQQSAGVRVQTSHQFLVHAQSEMAGPWKSINALGKDAADLSCPCRGSAHDQWLTVVAQRMAGGLIEVADRGADGPGLQCWSLLPQPAQAELGLTAAFAAHQFVHSSRITVCNRRTARRRVARASGCGHQNLAVTSLLRSLLLLSPLRMPTRSGQFMALIGSSNGERQVDSEP